VSRGSRVLIGFDFPFGYPAGFARRLAPFACNPVEIAGRNRMMRTLLLEAIRGDLAWNGGYYPAQPRPALVPASDVVMLMVSAPLALQAPSSCETMRVGRSRSARRMARVDATRQGLPLPSWSGA